MVSPSSSATLSCRIRPVAMAAGRQGDGVGDHQLVELGGRDPVHGGARQHGVGDVGQHLLGPVLLQGAGGVAQGARRIHHVVHQDADLALDLADDVHHLRHVGPRPPLVDDGEVGVVHALGDGARADDAAHVGRHHHHVGILLPPQVAEQDGRRVDVVHGNREEALDLVGVEIHREHVVDAGLGDHAGHHAGRDRHPRGARPAILPGIAEVGNHRGDARGRGAPAGIGQHQQLHQVVVHRRAGGLHEEDIPAPHVLVDLDQDLAVAEAADLRAAERLHQVLGDALRQVGIGVPGEDR